MEGQAGWTMIAHSASRHRLTHHCGGTRFYPHSRHPPCLALDRAKGPCSATCVARLITLGLSVPCFLYIPQQIAPLITRLPLPDANQIISASHGTGACASSRVTVDIGTFVPPVTCHTKRGIVLGPLTAPFISSNAAPLHNPAHMLHLLLSPMPARENC